MSSRPTQMKSEFDMDTFFDFNQSTTQPSPMTATSSSHNDALSPFGKSDERQQYNGPSHDYNQYKQQVGLPVGSMANLPPMSQQQTFDGYNSGIGDMGFDGGFGGWSSGIDIDSDMAMDFNNPQSSMPAMFFPPSASNDASASDNFVNPTSIGGQEETASSVRLWPGMHSQRAQQVAMQKAHQVQAVQQRQTKLQTQQAQYQRHASNASQTQMPQPQQVATNGKRASHPADPHVEESISRLLNQMRQQSNASADEDADGMLPHIARMKKDEEEMDEDERLLNSDEGKKLSSKERRQLRNKVSARAFRSRRKEYIGQLEGDLAHKAQEQSTLRQENAQLLQENDRYRGLIETLLRHPAFTPFIQDISKDPAVLGMPQHQTQHLQAPSQQQQQQQAASTPAQQPTQPHQQQPQQQQQTQQDIKPEYMNFDASQLQIPTQDSQQQVSLAMIPEENFSKLNLGNRFQRSMDFNNYSVNAYPVTEMPLGPDPVDLLGPTPARLPAAYSTTYDANSISDMDALLYRLDGAARRMTPT